ncbi:uncharacterized protein CLUP02_15068 [Colletotrichum lupini]|uniref:Uncharacterized protein n=1 Tax=Colletotrichum lupini TaxID=145971 RepID=A0A9Q8T7A0_9PEZI|nr:uncharacterized protein CLUP02_15068 [Colletotrichum lupini]UQC89537.1 hypothetical protein CLUP02_15068 [Colletotrichum lupini]
MTSSPKKICPAQTQVLLLAMTCQVDLDLTLNTWDLDGVSGGGGGGRGAPFAEVPTALHLLYPAIIPPQPRLEHFTTLLLLIDHLQAALMNGRPSVFTSQLALFVIPLDPAAKLCLKLVPMAQLKLLGLSLRLAQYPRLTHRPSIVARETDHVSHPPTDHLWKAASP